MGQRFLLHKAGLWSRSNSRGCASSIAFAGLYSEAEALAIVNGGPGTTAWSLAEKRADILSTLQQVDEERAALLKLLVECDVDAGTAASEVLTRKKVLAGIERAVLRVLQGKAVHEPVTEAELDEMDEALRRELDADYNQLTPAPEYDEDDEADMARKTAQEEQD